MYTEDEIKSFYQNYRDSLDRQNQANLQNLDQQRRNAQASIMSGANKAGMMYSNFPERSKIQYDQNSYQPTLVKIQNSYLTGLDTLRKNILKYQNSIADIQDSIAHLNSMK
jgi:hypothetical protein